MEFPMPRKPRFYLPDIPAHIVQRGNDRQPAFFAEADYSAYLDWLAEGAQKHGCAIHAYVLMTNHVHILLTPHARDSISRLVQFVGRNYVTYINRAYQRTGTLWEGRHKGSLVGADDYLLACYRYIELNPVRAGMVSTPGDYRWSSFAANAFGLSDKLVYPHERYRALGNTDEQRLYAYQELFRNALEPDHVHSIRASVQTGTPLGNDRFRAQVEAALGKRVGQARRGRPHQE
jgi:putative transposase